MNFTAEQHEAISLDANLVVVAGAGSGKTRVLVERYLRLLYEMGAAAQQGGEPLDGSSLLAITFTEKAAREMRDRVRATVEQRARAAPTDARPLWEELRTAVEASRIGTIHSFCATLLRDHPAESGIDPGFVVLEESDAVLLLSESATDALSQAVQQPAYAPLFEEFSPTELHTMLTEMVGGGAEVQAAFALLPATADDLLTLWKTRLAQVQTTVAAELLGSPGWREAWETLKTLAPLAPPADRIGRQVCDLVARKDDFLLSPPDFSLIAAVDLRGGSKKAWNNDTDSLNAARQALQSLREDYRTVAHLLTLVFDPEAERRVARAVLALRDLYGLMRECYNQRKSQRDALDFDDLIAHTRRLLEHVPAVRARWQAELRAVLVDEFQDTDDNQRAIVYALCGFAPAVSPTPSSPTPSLFVVGDGKQSIYRFRGADVSVFRRVESDIQQQQGQAIHMDTSFRTHPPLLEWINGVTGALLLRERPLHPYEVTFEPLRPHRPPPTHEQCVELHIVTGDTSGSPSADTSNNLPADTSIGARRDTEARVLAARIKALVSGEGGKLVYDHAEGKWRVPTFGDMAMLFRASTVFEHYEQALRAEGIPFLTTAGRGYYGRKEIQDLIHLLSVLNDPLDDLSLVGVLRSPLFALDDATIVRLRVASSRSLWGALMNTEARTEAGNEGDEQLDFARRTLHTLHTMRGRVSAVELLRAALAATGYMATISSLEEGDRRRANVEKLLETARQNGQAGPREFSRYLETLIQTETRESEATLEAEGSVRLMTVHRSKGLEFPIVILPDLGRTAPPQRTRWMAQRAYGVALQLRNEAGEWQKPVAFHEALWTEQQMERAEHERLLYVALTRARDYLLLSGQAASRSGEDWLGRILTALGYPWEMGGPPAGNYGALAIWHHPHG
jgi:ATP-dependent helicase/nuclease subunit A